MTFKPGDKLNKNKYTIEREHGKGRFGITYIAQKEKGDRVIVKTFDKDIMQTTDPQRLINNLLKEGNLLTKLKHPHIVKIEDSFIEKIEASIEKNEPGYDLFCLVLEYVPGINLDERKDKILSEETAINYIHQIGKALIEVHKLGAVHRDVKPQNIVIKAGSAEVILIDFGLARNIGHNLSIPNPESETSAGYAPIELYFNDETKHPCGPYTDVYSLAATLYNLLTGKVPTKSSVVKVYLGGNVTPELLASGELPQTNQPIKNQWDITDTPKKINPKITDKTNRAIQIGMALQPDDRPQTMQEWLDLLPPSTISEPIPIPDNHFAQESLKWAKLELIIPAIIGIIGIIIAVIGQIPSWLQILNAPKQDQPTPTNSQPTNSQPTNSPK